ncbi:MAG: D-alanine--D-alanine ligase [Candidatus Cloacimonadota bacterium]|nr:D-alanine--D-alanine ligase [Candidatus Cloacimonadota bacterium]
MERNKKIVILAGGNSEEREVSLESSRQIAKTLKKYQIHMIDPSSFNSYLLMVEKIKSIDPLIVFNGLHGAEGEDGRIQALLELENIQFSGSRFRASAICMDKIISRLLAKCIGIIVPPNIVLHNKKKADLDKIISKISLPLVVKPNDSGSSVGITIVQNKSELNSSIEKAFAYSEKVICEKYITGRELTVTILDNKALPVVEIKPKTGWYDFTNKYTHGKTIYEVPAKLTSQEKEKIQRQSLKIFRKIGCKSYGRVDFRYDGNNFYFLEVNTLPGMTELSLTPMAAAEAGLDFESLLEKIIATSLD